MKIYLKLPDGEEIGFKRRTMDPDKFRTVCQLVAFGLYVELARVITDTGDFFVILYFFLLTAAIAGGWLIWLMRG